MPGELEGKTILLVDDDRDILAAMTAALSDMGPQIVTALNGNDALTEAGKHNPDLVVLDMMLPGRSGFLVMEKLKRGKKRSDPPRVIMITGNQGARQGLRREPRRGRVLQQALPHGAAAGVGQEAFDQRMTDG